MRPDREDPRVIAAAAHLVFDALCAGLTVSTSNKTPERIAAATGPDQRMVDRTAATLRLSALIFAVPNSIDPYEVSTRALTEFRRRTRAMLEAGRNESEFAACRRHWITTIAQQIVDDLAAAHTHPREEL
jgi:hypothetical protein